MAESDVDLSDNDSSSSYVPTSETEEEEISETDMEEDDVAPAPQAAVCVCEDEDEEEEEEEEDEDDDDSEDMQTEIDLERIKTILQARKSNKVDEIMAYCVSENEMIAQIYKIVLERIDVLNKDEDHTPAYKALSRLSKDSLIHVLEYISDHIESVTSKVKRCC